MKKTTAWILFVAMVLNMALFVGAAPKGYYTLATYANRTEKEYAKIEFDNDMIVIPDVDGGKGGKAPVRLTYATAPNVPSKLNFAVGEEVTVVNLEAGSKWFDEKEVNFEVTLQEGKNTITITRNEGKIIHLGKMEIGDEVVQETVPAINGTKYYAKDFATDTEQEFGKITNGTAITFTGIDGGDGGNADIIVELSPEPNSQGVYSLTCNDQPPVTIQALNAGKWFDMGQKLTSVFLNPGKDNKIILKEMSGKITHINYIEVGKADGSKENANAPKPAQEIGTDQYVADETGKYLSQLGLLKGDASGNLMLEDTLSRQDSVVLLSRLTGAEEEAAAHVSNSGFSDIGDALYEPYIAWAKEKNIVNGVSEDAFGYDQQVTQQQFFALLLRTMGYTGEKAIDYDLTMNKALQYGIANGMDVNVFNSSAITRGQMAQSVYNALKAHTADGEIFGETIGRAVEKPEVYLRDGFDDSEVDTDLWSLNGAAIRVEDGKLAIQGGKTASVATANKYRRYEMTFTVEALDAATFSLGLLAKEPTSSQESGNLWISFGDKLTISGGDKGDSIPVHTQRLKAYPGVAPSTLRVRDLGETIQIFSMTGDGEVPIIEIRLTNEGAVVYRNGSPIGTVRGSFQACGHIIWRNESGRTFIDDVSITAPDPVFNPELAFYSFDQQQPVSITETFDDDIFNYRAFHERSKTAKIEEGELVLGSGSYAENLLSTQIRLTKPVVETDIRVEKGSGEIQLNVANRSVGDDWYSGLNFIAYDKAEFALHVDAWDINHQETITMPSPVDFRETQRVRVTDDGETILYEVKQGENWLRLAKVERADDALVVYDAQENKMGELDRFAREIGYVRLYSYMNNEAHFDNVKISGMGALPQEIEPLNPAPVPDEDKKFEVNDHETVVGMGYFVYFNKQTVVDGKAVLNNSEVEIPKMYAALQETDPAVRDQKLDEVKWGYMWWAEPKVGFYNSRMKDVMYEHMKDLAAADVDFIYIDQTNMYGGQSPNPVITNLTALFDLIVEMQERGEKVPYVAIWSGADNRGDGVDDTGREMWQQFYSNPKYKNIWVYYGGKPFQLYTFDLPQSYSTDLTDKMEIRRMWTSGDKGTWVFHAWNSDAKGRLGYDMEGNLEAINVQPYHSTNFNGNMWTGLGKYIESDAGGRDQGRAYQEFWKGAFEYRPKFVMIWAYNHWDVVMNRPAYKVGEEGKTTIGDNFSRGYSGGLEPTKDPYGPNAPGDIYMTWTKQYIEAYKQNQPMPDDLTGY